MRYRPFGRTEMAVSAVSLALSDAAGRRDAADWRAVVFAALENGVNAFELDAASESLADGAADGLKAIDRRLVFVSLKISEIDPGAEALAPSLVSQRVEEFLSRTGLGYLDALIFHEPDNEFSNDTLYAVKALRDTGVIRQIGVAGEGPGLDPYIASGQFDVLVTPFSLLSGWGTRNRIRDAGVRNMAIIGYDFCPAQIGAAAPAAAGLSPRRLFWGRRPADEPEPDSAYSFLHETPNWTAEELCLSYALTQPALATVQITAEQISRLEMLAETVEREMPPGLAPRIEMARFGGAPIAARA